MDEHYCESKYCGLLPKIGEVSLVIFKISSPFIKIYYGLTC